MKNKKTILLSGLLLGIISVYCQNFNGLNVNLGNLYRTSHAETRSISPENLTGEKGKGGMTKLEDGSARNAARELGQGWKVNPYIVIKPGMTFVMGEVEGQGAIQHIWITPTGNYRLAIFRFYWDDETVPSVEAPIGDFFASGWGWGNEPQINSIPICVNPQNGFNSYWQMPFRKKFKITMQNLSTNDLIIYYQIDYTLTQIPDDAAYFHAQFNRTNPVIGKPEYVILDNVKGNGQYVGTYMAHGSNSPGWWGEGEVKFFMDGDTEYPTICGTGEEDYFCGSYAYEMRKDNKGNDVYTDFSSPYTGFYHVKDTLNSLKQTRFGEYRWHILDPIRFEKDLKVTIQALGWKENGAYLPLEDDLASVAYWYQTEPHSAFPKLPSIENLVIRKSRLIEHKGLNKSVQLNIEPSLKYNYLPASLTDGYTGTSDYTDGNWMGFEGNNPEIIVDLKTILSNGSISTSFLSDQNAWIFLPSDIEFYVSENGKQYKSVANFKNELQVLPLSRKEFKVDFNEKTQYIKIVIKNIGKCPVWHKGSGGKAWIFIDEIIVD